jgi:hypothetical protein
VNNRRVLLIVLAVAAAAVGIWLLGYALFNTGSDIPGSGTGTIVETTP